MVANDDKHGKKEIGKRLRFCLPQDMTNEQMVEFFMALKLAQEEGYLEEEIQLSGEELKGQGDSNPHKH